MAQILRDPCRAMHRSKGLTFAVSFMHHTPMNAHGRLWGDALTNLAARR
jgi:hypothetical protein